MADDTKDDASPYKPDTRPPASELVQRLVAEHGTMEAALSVVAKERWNDRERVRVAEKERDDLRKKLEKGSRVLSDQEAAEYDAYKALGLEPDKVKGLQTKVAEYDAKEAERAEDERWTEAATLAEYTKPKVLQKLAKLEGFNVELRDEKEDGKPVRKAYAVVGDDKTPLSEYITANHADYLPSLTAGDEKKEAPKQQQSSPYPAQSPRGAAPAPKQKSTDDLVKEKAGSGMYAQF